MSFVFVLLVLLILGGLVTMVLLPNRRPRSDEDVTSRAVRPPAHPTRPLPGSATRRGAQGQP